MIQQNQKKIFGFAVLLILMFVFGFFTLLVSCKTPENHFSGVLRHIDIFLESGNTKKAIAELRSLRSKAKSSSNWLSIAKRERALGRFDFACETLRLAHAALPANELVSAVLIDSLYRSNNYEEAVINSDAIQNTPLAIVGSSVVIKSYLDGYIENALPSWWEKAFLAGAGNIFGRNAAVFYASESSFLKGAKIQEGSFTNLPNDRLFRALISYHASLYDRASEVLQQAPDISLSAQELLLSADIALHRELPEWAGFFWRQCIKHYPLVSPVPFYNVAVLEKSAQSYIQFLETCLSKFPSYPPAVIRYSRIDQLHERNSRFNYVQQTLSELGIYSLEMERILDTFLPTPTEIQAVLDASLVDQSNIDIRLHLENFRFFSIYETERVRSTALIWALLEKFPKDEYPLLHEYSVWFFASRGEYPTAFTLNNERLMPDPLYTGIELMSNGNIEYAEISFRKSLETTGSWAALANLGLVHKKKNDLSQAIEFFSQAAQLTTDTKTKSQMHYETAVCLVSMKLIKRAHTILGYALELNPSNYKASALRISLENRL